MDHRKFAAVAGGFAVAALLAAGFYFAVPRTPAEARLHMLDAFVGQLPPTMTVDYAGAHAGDAGEVVATDLVVENGEMGRVAVRELVLRDFDTENQVPNRVDMTLRGIVLPLENAEADVRAMLAELGYERIEMDVDYAYTYSPESQHLELSGVTLSVPGMGALTVKAALGNLASFGIADRNAAMQAMMQMMVEGGELSYRDDSLVRRILRHQAEQSGVSEAELKTEIIAQIDAQSAHIDDPLAHQALDAVKQFIQSPGEIVLTVRPSQPFNALEMMLIKDDPAQVQERLGLQVIAR